MLFGIYPVKEDFKEKGQPTVTQGILPGQALMGEMQNHGDRIYFSFPVNFEPNDQNNFISINLTPIKGTYS